MKKDSQSTLMVKVGMKRMEIQRGIREQNPLPFPFNFTSRKVGKSYMVEAAWTFWFCSRDKLRCMAEKFAWRTLLGITASSCYMLSVEVQETVCEFISTNWGALQDDHQNFTDWHILSAWWQFYVFAKLLVCFPHFNFFLALCIGNLDCKFP